MTPRETEGPELQEELDQEELDQEQLEALPVPDGWKRAPPLPQETPRDADPSDPLAELRDMFGDNVSHVWVARLERGGAREHVTTYPADVFSIDILQKEYGGGRYLCTLKDPDSKYLGSRTVHIWGAPRDPNAQPERESLAVQLEKSHQELRSILEAVRNPPEGAQQTNYLELALGLLGAIQGMQAPYIEALLKRNTGPSTGEMMDVFLKGMEMARDMNPEPSPYGPVLNTFAPMLSKILTAGEQLPPGAGAPPPPPPRPADPNPRPEWDVILGPFVPTLQQWAAANKNAELRAALVMDEVPEAMHGLILDQLGRGEAFLAEFHALHPETKPLARWYRAFWGSVASMFEWEDDETPGDQEELEGVQNELEGDDPDRD